MGAGQRGGREQGREQQQGRRLQHRYKARAAAAAAWGHIKQLRERRVHSCSSHRGALLFIQQQVRGASRPHRSTAPVSHPPTAQKERVSNVCHLGGRGEGKVEAGKERPRLLELGVGQDQEAGGKLAAGREAHQLRPRLGGRVWRGSGQQWCGGASSKQVHAKERGGRGSYGANRCTQLVTQVQGARKQLHKLSAARCSSAAARCAHPRQGWHCAACA